MKNGSVPRRYRAVFVCGLCVSFQMGGGEIAPQRLRIYLKNVAQARQLVIRYNAVIAFDAADHLLIHIHAQCLHLRCQILLTHLMFHTKQPQIFGHDILFIEKLDFLHHSHANTLYFT